MRNNYIKDLLEIFYTSKVSKRFQQIYQKWFLQNRDNGEQDKALYELWNQTSQINNTTEEDLKEVHEYIEAVEVRKHKRTISWLKIASAIILPLLAIGTGLYWTLQNGGNTSVMHQYYVERGDVQNITLSDGTVVWINSESTLIYPEIFDKDKRVVYLVGEANFDVSKSDKQPFIVQTSKMNIEVLGTKFNIQAYPNSLEYVATLEEGKVLLNIDDEKDTSIFLNPREAVFFNTKTGDVNKKVVNIDDLNAWSKGTLGFSGASLEFIFQQIERKYDIRVSYTLGASYNADQQLTIRFAPDDSVEDILKVLQDMVPGLKVRKANK